MAYRSSASTEMCFTSSTISHPFCGNSEHWVLYFSHFWNSTRSKSSANAQKTAIVGAGFADFSLKHTVSHLFCTRNDDVNWNSPQFKSLKSMTTFHGGARSAGSPDDLLKIPPRYSRTARTARKSRVGLPQGWVGTQHLYSTFSAFQNPQRRPDR